MLDLAHTAFIRLNENHGQIYKICFSVKFPKDSTNAKIHDLHNTMMQIDEFMVKTNATINSWKQFGVVMNPLKFTEEVLDEMVLYFYSIFSFLDKNNIKISQELRDSTLCCIQELKTAIILNEGIL